MIAMSVLPISDNTLVYGSKDAGDTVSFGEEKGRE